ncbi:formate dehydrogenase accessory sulfurtransferase FdhD [Berryella wangjianweii]|nr:formate dehydrogenase accessory sulfurtransferase FdhD [Berryella wangjianweii]
MEALDRSEDQDAVVRYAAQMYTREGAVHVRDEEVQGEHALDVHIDGTLAMRIVCSPSDLIELVLGRLFSEGIIQAEDDVDFMYLCEHGTIVRVLLKRKRALKPVEAPVVPSCCTGNKVFEALEQLDDDLRPVRPIDWDPAWVFALADVFAADTPMHRKTFGAHSCYLAIDGEVRYVCEDLGRHNAFDKVVGHALKNRDDLSRAVVFTSGRIPVDMVTKAIRAGIPVLASKAVPTDLTIELAHEFSLTLICSAHPDSMRVYSDPRWKDAPPRAGSWDASALPEAPARA